MLAAVLAATVSIPAATRAANIDPEHATGTLWSMPDIASVDLHHWHSPSIENVVGLLRWNTIASVLGLEDDLATWFGFEDTIHDIGTMFKFESETEGWMIPVTAGQPSSRFGFRLHPITHRRQMHRGMDFAARRGTGVRAASDGIVISAGRAGTYGRLIIVDHGDGLETRYAHLQRIKVEAGDIVNAGDLIATVGATGRATGPHLHFEVRRHGRAINPRPFFNGL